MLRLSIEAAHWLSLAPLAYLVLFRRGASTAFWLVALGFAVSFAADTIALLTGGSWIAVPWYMLVQWAFFLTALTTDDLDKIAPAVLVYVGLGTAFYLPMVARREDYDAFMAFWYPYQGTRLAAFALFVGAAWRT